MTLPSAGAAPYSNQDPLIPTGPANDAGPAPVDRDADYSPALTPGADQTILHQHEVEKVIDARVAALKAAGKI